ncbi:MAG: bifunctional UDP-N-acetylglucosamine diphosphorylase/glucosamine-1-phosphate N-acetyltransferase GlmU, partial [candidate division Zixibacteria bacterium]|nr:bifunctional UDP-N-acetylglucosamine diphosphorylase/glucosamine-1-phosphate N-acetyltransferase GlmU [candidate division Zixibacteria bacterium]NIW39609.1 bifunctional UDP-N-acetylglucosamine diphosphorylase/glucosamine-1-phosphate N-acetyltransferase GlmU [candidate division Zixibacteria bacterium]
LIRDLIRTRQSQNYAASFLSALYEQPPPYGRVVREKSGRVLRIVEEEDATEVEKNIKEVNSSHYCFDTPKLMEAIMKIRSDNAQKEYYLPDVIEILVKDDHGVEALQVDNPLLIAGINTRKDLADGVETLKKRIIEKWLENHVTIIDPATTYIDATVRIGKDTIIYPFTFLSGHSDIGNDCRIGPFVRMVSSNIEDGVSINWVNMEKNKIIRESSSKKFRR